MKRLRFTVLTVVFGSVLLANIALGEVVVSQNVYDGAHGGMDSGARLIQSLGGGFSGEIESISYAVSALTGTPFPSFVDQNPVISWYPSSGYCGIDVDSCYGDTSINRIDRVFPTTTSCSVGPLDTITGLENRTIYFCNATYTGSTFNPDYFYTVMFFENSWGTLLGSFADTFPNGHPMAYYGSIGSLGDVYFQVNTVSVPKVRNPVLIIPGVLGTEMFNGTEKLWLDFDHNYSDRGDEFMDSLQFNENLTPSVEGLIVGDVIHKIIGHLSGIEIVVLNYTSELIQEFQNQGYEEGTELFLFPYDWRYGVSDDIVLKLKQKIEDILTQTGKDKIDIIAHSTGGLLAKKYVIQNPTDHKIDKAIFVGVPNTGAPQSVKTLLLGSSFGNPFLDPAEMQKIAKNLPVVYDLTPSEKYYNTKGSYVRIIETNPLGTNIKDLDFGEIDRFLLDDRNLNTQALENAHNLHSLDFDDYDLRTNGVDLYSINGCKAGTLDKIIERRTSGFGGVSIVYDQPDLTPGDGTVPLESATNLPIDSDKKYFDLKTEHSKMLSDEGARQQIVNIISGSNLPTDDITQDISGCELNGRAIAIYSPISINVVDQDGNRTGMSSGGAEIENNIPNALFEIMGEEKFLYLPEDEGQTYDINIYGTGDGVFTITDIKIENNEKTGMQVFSDIDVTTSLGGELYLGDVTTLELDTDNDGIFEKILVPDSVLDKNSLVNFDPTHKPKVAVIETEDTRYSSSGSTRSEGDVESAYVNNQSDVPKLEDFLAQGGLESSDVSEEKSNGEVLAENDIAITNENNTNLETFGSSSNSGMNPMVLVFSFAGFLILVFVVKKTKKG